MKTKRLKMLLAALCLAGVLAGCGNTQKAENDGKGTIKVGAVSLTEGQLVSELYALALEDAGYTVEREEGLDMAIEAIQADEIDLYPEYTGSAYTRYMAEEPMYDSAEMTRKVRDYYLKNENIAVLEPSEINNSYGICMLREKAEEMGIETFADLQKNAEKMVWGDWGFLAMPTTGRVRIEDLYGEFNFKEVVDIDMSLSYDMLDSEDVDVIPVCTTDPQLSNDKYLMLDPEKDVWCEYLLVPFVRQEVMEDYPEIEEILNNVSSKLNNEEIIPLIYKCNIDMEDVHDVAKEFYENTYK